jgi:hypothetical protein
MLGHRPTGQGRVDLPAVGLHMFTLPDGVETEERLHNSNSIGDRTGEQDGAAVLGDVIDRDGQSCACDKRCDRPVALSGGSARRELANLCRSQQPLQLDFGADGLDRREGNAGDLSGETSRQTGRLPESL